MKSLPFLFACLLLAAPWARAQNDSFGTIRATVKLRPDGSKSTTITDPDKHTAEETISNAAGKMVSKTTYILGENDVAESAIFYNAKGEIIYKASYKRDVVGNVTETAFASPDDQYLGKRVFVYGPDGKASQVIDYDANGQVIPTAQTAAGKPAKKHH